MEPEVGIEYEHRLTEVESRTKSNTHRIDKLEESTEAINRLATSMEVMLSEQKHQTSAISKIETNVAKLDSKVETIEQKPAKRWESVTEKAILMLVTAVLTYIFTKIGLQ